LIQSVSGFDMVDEGESRRGGIFCARSKAAGKTSFWRVHR
jgi:hypothetical protein